MPTENVRDFLHHHELLCDSVTMARIQHGKNSLRHRLSRLAFEVSEEHAELLLDASFSIAHIAAPFLKFSGIHNSETIHLDIEKVREGFDSSNEIYSHYKSHQTNHHKMHALHHALRMQQSHNDFSDRLLKHQNKRLNNRRNLQILVSSIAAISAGLSISSLVTEHALHLTAGAVIAPVASFALAVHEFAKATKTAKAAWRAHKKRDVAYLWLDRITQLEKANRKIQYCLATGDQFNALKWQQKRNRHANQAEALFQLMESDPGKYIAGKHHFNWKQERDFRQAYYAYKFNVHYRRPRLSSTVAKKIQHAVLKKQEKKFKKLAWQASLRYVGAIGLACLAVAALPGVGQAVLIAGIVITAAIGIIKARHVYKHWNQSRLSANDKRYIENKTHFVTDHYQIKDEDEQLIHHFFGTNIKCFNRQFQVDLLYQDTKARQGKSYTLKKFLSDFNRLTPQQQKLYLGSTLTQYKKRISIAYQYHRQLRGTDYSLYQFMQSLDAMKPKQSRELLLMAERRYHQDIYLCNKQLGSAAPIEERQQFLQSLSPKHRIQLIKTAIKKERALAARNKSVQRKNPFIPHFSTGKPTYLAMP